MIIQGLLDFISIWLAGLLALIPPLPAEWSDALDQVADAGGYLGGILSDLGPLIPWLVVAQLVQWFIAAMAFWLAMLPVRLVLWLVGR